MLSTLCTQATQVTSPVNWASVNIALIKSIRKGFLFNRKYWVRGSRTGGVLRPVYLSSIIVDDKIQQLNTCALEFDSEIVEILRSVLSG